MKRLLILLFLLSNLVCYCQIKRLTVDFAPSFIERSQLSIVKENPEYSITIQNSKINETWFIADSSLLDLQLQFVDYFRLKYSSDSIKNIEEREQALKGIHIVELDGISVKGDLIDNFGDRVFDFRSPRKGTIDQNLMSALYKVMYKAFTKPQTITYLEQLEGYFAFGLGLRKLNESPLTYKIYGSISSDEEKELLDFFRSLPTDKDIYFDMSNFSGMGTMFYDDFYTLCNRNRGIYWIDCSDSAKKHLAKAGIMSTNIR
jgi:hypothetical protein